MRCGCVSRERERETVRLVVEESEHEALVVNDAVAISDEGARGEGDKTEQSRKPKPRANLSCAQNVGVEYKTALSQGM